MLYAVDGENMSKGYNHCESMLNFYVFLEFYNLFILMNIALSSL